MAAAADRLAIGRRPVRRERHGHIVERLDDVADESPIVLIYNGHPFAVMMASAQDLEDFALGFSLSERIVERLDDIRIHSITPQLEGISIELEIPAAALEALQTRRRSLEGRSGCGVCGSQMLESVLRPPPPVQADLRISVESLRRAMAGLREQQWLNARTGATHAAGWADSQGRIACVREDVGRHNALDKLIGALARDGIDARQGFIVISSRASYEMVMKAAQTGVGLLAAISAPTTLAVALAHNAGMTLIGFAREDGQAVYSHPQRLLSAPTTVSEIHS